MRGRKTGGRRKGTPNKVTAEARIVCAAVLDDATYRTNLTARARAGTLAPAVEAMLWHYAFGKPRNSLDVTVGPAGDLSELSTEDLLHRVDRLREQVREQAARERALPASRMAGGAREHAVHGRDTVAGPMNPTQIADANVSPASGTPRTSIADVSVRRPFEPEAFHLFLINTKN